MQMFDNINTFVKDDLKQEIRSGSKVSIAAACFSIYAYQELKEQLSEISELRFIFTSPTFTTERAPKEKREFFIPRQMRESTLCGSDFEIKLRNELTQKAIAKECADWIRQKVKFKSNISKDHIPGFVNVASEQHYTYFPFDGFTTTDLGCDRGNNAFCFIHKLPAESQQSQMYLQAFNSLWNDSAKMQDVTEQVIDNISVAYRENAPEFIYFVTLYNIFNEFLEDISEDVLPDEALGFKNSLIWNKLYDFQKDAVLAVINKLEKYNGCILADSVGLGKTFSALAVIKYYEKRNKSVLVLCPKKLANNWNTFKGNYVNNPIAGDRLGYDVLYHTDLSRNGGVSNGIDLYRLNWENYGLVVIDESHNFRNGGNTFDYDEDDNRRENRYTRLMNRIIRKGITTKVLMLSATPVNNRFSDLKNQIALAYEGKPELWEGKLNTKHSIDEIFRQAQMEFNAWSKLPADERTADALLERLDFDFFELLDSVTIARSRKHIEKYYDTAAIGKFPTRLVPDSPRPSLTNRPGAINYNEIYEQLQALSLMIYLPSCFIFDSAKPKYGIEEDSGSNLSQLGREKGIHHLMSVGLLKRLESSVHSFRLTLERIKELNEKTIRTIDRYEQVKDADLFEFTDLANAAAAEDDEDAGDLFSVGRKVKIDLADMDYESWRQYLLKDVENLDLLIEMIKDITPEYDNKLQDLLKRISWKINNPINPGNRKIIIFTAFSDTAEYLYKHISAYVTENHKLHTAMITGDADGRSTVPGLKMDINTVLTLFSPISKEKHLLYPDNKDDIDILIATDCISEGQNLQDCDYLINYDIHWNPVRLIQRFGRIDRIGSKNEKIQLVNYWPDMTLDDYIQLKDRVETRMKITVMTATGDDDPINQDTAGDLEYRRKQLERLQNEVVDIEEMNTGITIMDLGLNEFRLDLLDYIKNDGDINKAPHGLHAVVPSSEECPPGVIYVLRNVNESINIDKQNRLHPFYMVYLQDDGSVLCHHLAPKKLLDTMRLLCKGKNEPLKELCREFNKETRDGKKMDHYSELLGEAINSIINKKEESDIDSLFSAGGTSALENVVSGLNDFELICFLVIKEKN